MDSLVSRCRAQLRHHKILVMEEFGGAAELVRSAESPLEALVTDCRQQQLIALAAQHRASMPILLLSSQLLKQDGRFFTKQYIGYGISHITALNPGSDFHLIDLPLTLRKLLDPHWRTSELGLPEGIRSYLGCDEVRYCSRWIPSSYDKTELSTQLKQDALEWGVGQQRAGRIFALAEEMCSNAIYDAPVEAGLSASYGTITKKRPLVLRPEHWPRLEWGRSKNLFAVGVRDPFGALHESCLMKHLQKIRHRGEVAQIMEFKNQGGAGLGFFKIFLSCHALVVHVKKSSYTESIALYDLSLRSSSGRASRSLHFFCLS